MDPVARANILLASATFYRDTLLADYEMEADPNSEYSLLGDDGHGTIITGYLMETLAVLHGHNLGAAE